ncbi:hypothetical protein ACFQ0M_47585 [Kitasatospora aburaviensis]|uniref:Uncharacterized protein n=1 Tax=Kitasatospora aburaviensis TaxID=67265 RepID=A0ABW1EYK7_9ACTN
MTSDTTRTTLVGIEPNEPQAPGTAPLTLGLTVIETTVFALDVPLDEVPIELIEFYDDGNGHRYLCDEQHTLMAWLNDYRELWIDRFDPAKHTQTTEDLEVVNVDVRDWPPSTSG